MEVMLIFIAGSMSGGLGFVGFLLAKVAQEILTLRVHLLERSDN